MGAFAAEGKARQKRRGQECLARAPWGVDDYESGCGSWGSPPAAAAFPPEETSNPSSPKPPEVKHFSRAGEQNANAIPPVVASESGATARLFWRRRPLPGQTSGKGFAPRRPAPLPPLVLLRRKRGAAEMAAAAGGFGGGSAVDRWPPARTGDSPLGRSGRRRQSQSSRPPARQRRPKAKGKSLKGLNLNPLNFSLWRGVPSPVPAMGGPQR